MSTINIRQELLNIDKETYNEYDLTTLYESLNLSVSKKKKLVEHIVNHKSPKELQSFMLGKPLGTRKQLNESVSSKKGNHLFESKLQPYDPDNWTQEDIDLHKSIDWKARDFEKYPVEEDSFKTTATLYYEGGYEESEPVEFIKYLRANPIYPPYYAPKEDPFSRSNVGFMYDGRKKGKYEVHDITETQEVYDTLMSESKERNKENCTMNKPVLNEVDYGGAYDINPEEYFTKEDYMELLDEVVDKIKQDTEIDFDIEDFWVDDEGVHISLQDREEETVTYADFQIDMRRIRKPKDLLKYTDEVVKQLKDNIWEDDSDDIDTELWI